MFSIFSQKMDVHMTSAGFHQNVGVSFLNALLSEIEAAFDMESIQPIQPF